MTLPDAIIPASYWVTSALAAGQYPGSHDPREAPTKVNSFLRAGVTTFVDLTHEWDRMEPYEHLLSGQTHHHFPIVDMSIPTVAEMKAILDTTDNALEAHETVYVHCWGGHGHTGTVIGCWLVRHGFDPADAVGLIDDRRKPLPIYDANPRSPQTSEQHRFIHAWTPGG